MINTKHVLIMCSSYPLMTPSSFQALVVSCLMGNVEKHCGVSRRLCRKSTNGNEVATIPPDTDMHVKSPVTEGILGKC